MLLDCVQALRCFFFVCCIFVSIDVNAEEFAQAGSISISTFNAHWIGPSMVVNSEGNTTVTRLYVDYDSLMIFADESNCCCHAIVEGMCYVRSPLNLVVPAKHFGTGTLVRINLTRPYRRTSTSVKTDPLLFCTALSKWKNNLSPVGFCMKNVLSTFSFNKDDHVVKANKVTKSKPFYVDVLINSIFKYPTNEEKHFTKRVLLCFLLLIFLFAYCLVAQSFNPFNPNVVSSNK